MKIKKKEKILEIQRLVGPQLHEDEKKIYQRMEERLIQQRNICGRKEKKRIPGRKERKIEEK